MKNIFLLTSILALAACGGGSGGGHGSVGGAAPTPDTPRIPDTLASVTATDNDAVTSMQSEVVVASNSNVPLQRYSHVNEGGIDFYSYRLEDIKLYAAAMANNPQDGYLQIGMDENTGRIDNIKMVVGGAGDYIAREGSTAKFRGPIYEYVVDEVHDVANQALVGTPEDRETYRQNERWDDDGRWVQEAGNWKYIEYGDQAVYRVVDTGQNKTQLEAGAVAAGKNLTGGHWNRIEEVMDVVTYGKNIGNGKSLQYADFGHFNPVYATKKLELKNDGTFEKEKTPRTDGQIDTLLQKEDYQLFAGGYAINGTTLQETLAKPANNTTFKGMAIGRVYTSIEGGANKTSHFASNGIDFDVDTNSDGIMDAYSGNAGHDISKAYFTKDATLTIDEEGKEILFMPFHSKSINNDKYYDVTIVKNGNVVEGASFVHNNNESAIEKQYRAYDAFLPENNIDAESGVNMGYYGVNTASEAAGTARMYSEQDFHDGTKREYEVQAAYGMKKQ